MHKFPDCSGLLLSCPVSMCCALQPGFAGLEPKLSRTRRGVGLRGFWLFMVAHCNITAATYKVLRSTMW